MIYRFGDFELDDSARELRDSGVRVETEPKAFELLLYLARHRDRAVSKDELLTELWPRQIVTETALSRCVMKARRAVGDDSERQAVIRTLHSHGYRFVAELDSGSDPATGAGPAESPPKRPVRGPLVAGVVLLLIVAAAGIWLQGRVPPPPPGVVAVLPVANLVADEDLGWVRVGLMSLMTRMLEERGIETAPEHTVLDAVGNAALTRPPDAALIERIRARSGADTVLHTTLDRRGGLHRITAVVTDSDGRRTQRIIVGDTPAGLAAELAGVITGLLSSADGGRPERFRMVSTDPLVNELYARALDLELRGELAAARDMFEVAATQAPELFWLRYEIALCTRDLREFETAERMFDELLDEAEAGADARALVVTLNSHGILHLRRNEYDQAEPKFERALETAIERGEPGDRATVLINLALISTRLGDVDSARRYYAEVVELYDALDERPSPYFLNNYAGFLLDHGDLAQAQAYSERAIAAFRLQGQRRYEAPALNRLAKILRQTGDLDGAQSRHEQAASIYREIGDLVGELSVTSALTSLYRAKGDLTRARLNAADVAERAAETGDELLLADAMMQTAYAARDFGEHRQARDEFSSARAVFERIGDDTGLRAADTGIALTSLELGDSDHAAAIADALLRAARAANNEAAEARARWLAGRVARTDGDTRGAITHFRSAIDYARANDDTNVFSLAAVDLATLALERGDLAEARVLADEIRPFARSEHDFLRLDARIAMAAGDTDRAAAIMSDLRQRAGEAWRDADEKLLAEAGS